MDIHIFSLLLGWASILTCILVLIWMIINVISPKKYRPLDSIQYRDYMRIIGFLAIFSTISVLMYQYYYELEVCELCWWQRIFMFPIDIIAITSLYYRVRDNHISILILSLFWTFFAGYHYYYHFKGWVLWQSVFLPCSVGWLLPACTDNHGILAFWFLTIPGMALLIFLSIVMLSILAHMKRSI